MTLGEYLIRYRGQQKITSAELGRQLDISKSFISYIENGWTEKCSFKNLIKIVRGLELTPDELYDIVMSCTPPEIKTESKKE